MGFSFNGLSGAAVTISGGITPNVTALGSSQTQVNVNGTGNGSSQNAYNVTSGKTFYLYGLQVSAGYTGTIYKNDGTTQVITHQPGAAVSGAIIADAPLAVYTSGQNVKITASNSSTYTIWGVEQ